jgi:hypothetical protein
VLSPVKHVRDDEWEDFEAVLHRHGRSVDEFEVVASQQVQIVPGPHISGLHGRVKVRHRQTGTERVYETGGLKTWAEDAFANDLATGVFPKPTSSERQP